MKKYLIVPGILLVCTVLSFIYPFVESNADHQAEEWLHYLSTRWFFIGVVASGLALIVLVVADFFEWLEKALEKRRIEKITRDRSK